MSNSAVFTPFLEQLQAVRNTLLFTPLPRWGIIEAKVTIALLCVSIVTWALELYIRRRKGTWVYRWEGGGYFRPNVQIFIPVSFLLFDSFYIVQMIAVIKRNDDPNKDWIPWFTLFYTAQTVPLILASAAWTWNSLLASKAMSEDQEVDPSKERDDRQVPLLSSKPKLVLLSVIAVTLTAIILIFTLGNLAPGHCW
ncbi:hypothetical protein BT69DRAFT_367735 [Atractiella rhizophila]|nr:hypothetical protein BT69DRAFT_367735 [Atractiella rhizophila]